MSDKIHQAVEELAEAGPHLRTQTEALEEYHQAIKAENGLGIALAMEKHFRASIRAQLALTAAVAHIADYLDDNKV